MILTIPPPRSRVLLAKTARFSPVIVSRSSIAKPVIRSPLVGLDSSSTVPNALKSTWSMMAPELLIRSRTVPSDRPGTKRPFRQRSAWQRSPSVPTRYRIVNEPEPLKSMIGCRRHRASTSACHFHPCRCDSRVRRRMHCLSSRQFFVAANTLGRNGGASCPTFSRVCSSGRLLRIRETMAAQTGPEPRNLPRGFLQLLGNCRRKAILY